MEAQPKVDIEKPWHAAYPEPQSTAAQISREALLEMFRDGKRPGHDFLLIDLRRTDHEGFTIRGSLNLPAQSLLHSLDTLYELCNGAGVPLVVFYCGSSRGRGARSAGWFQDTLIRCGEKTMKSVVLAGGIDGWLRAGEDYTNLVEGYTGMQQERQ